MDRKIEFKDGDEVVFTVSVDYNLKDVNEHTWKTLVLCPYSALELAERLQRFAEWTKHPLYQWAEKKVSQNV